MLNGRQTANGFSKLSEPFLVARCTNSTLQKNRIRELHRHVTIFWTVNFEADFAIRGGRHNLQLAEAGKSRRKEESKEDNSSRPP